MITVTLLTLTIIGLASAQIYTSQTNAGINPNNSFLGLIGSCFGIRNNQPSANQYVAPPAMNNSPVLAPNQNNGDNYGFGPCWVGFSPNS